MAMFGLLKKKEKTEEMKPATPQAEEMRAFAGQFLPGEVDILAVTGAGSFGGEKRDGDELYTVCMGLTAWMEEDSPEIHKGNFLLLTKADEMLMGYLRQRLPRDFIIKCKVRLHGDGEKLMLLNLPEPGFDPDLKAILTQQKKPVTVEVEELGTFVLNRSLGVLQREVDWQGSPVQLCMDPEGDHAACAKAALSILADIPGWDEKARAFAADKVLEQANAQRDDGGEDVSREEFVEGLEAESLDVAADGTFQLWFNDGGLFAGRFVRVSGSVSAGVTDAVMEG